MPRYFFHILDGTSLCDHEGMELPNLYTARSMAIRTSGEILRDMGERFWDGTEWRLEVTDEGGQVLFVLQFLAEKVLSASPSASLSL